MNNKILKALKNTFKNCKIPKNFEKLKIGDLKEWDSLGNYYLILEVEKIFKKKFSAKVFNEIKSISDIKKHLNKI
tara:strand:+ start:1150 stop:1374 length:225 start_codon:yes stop_codon:yes gene_type:complete